MRSSAPHSALTAAVLTVLAAGIIAVSAVSAGSVIGYQDITSTSGVNFRNANSPTSQKYLIETMGGGVAFLDFDQDGWQDLFFVNGAKIHDGQKNSDPPDKSGPEYWNRLYRNNRDGTLTDVTERAGVKGSGYGMGVAVGDYDNDGYPDLYVTSYGESTLYHNNRNGTFTDVSAKSGVHTTGWTTSAGFFDYDNDGKLDLFVLRYLDWTFASNVYCGSKEAAGRAYCHPDNFSPVANYLFHNNADGTFTNVSDKSRIGASKGKGLGLAFADFNQDGRMDVSVANDSFQQFLFLNNGDGTFTENAVPAGVGFTDDGKTFAGMGTDAADVDDDGFPDIVTSALSNESYAYFHNNGDGTFIYQTQSSGLGEITRLFAGWGLRIFDFNNEGRKGLFLANGHVMDNIRLTMPHLQYEQQPLLLRQVGSRFVNVSPQAGPVFQKVWASRGAAVGDLNNDGYLDIAVSNCGGPAYVLRNDGRSGNHWLGVRLIGRRSNRDGIGAHIQLTGSSGKVQHQMVTRTASYLSAQDPRVFFGIGQDKEVRGIQVTWPGGSKQQIANPKPDQILVIEENRK